MQPVKKTTWAEPVNTEAYDRTVAELKPFMADYSTTTSVPSKPGRYAVVSKVTGKVWLGETSNFTTLRARYYNKGVLPKEFAKYAKEGISFFLTTREIDVEQLRFNLEAVDALLHRATRAKDAPGKIVIITHSSGHYYLAKNRTNMSHHTVLTNFIARLVVQKHSNSHQSNTQLQQFVTDYAGDLLRETGFEVRELMDFKDSDDAIDKMNMYYIEQTKMICLNNVFDKR